ncbi:hypothetical protein AVEN_103965-1 [Araneus ventricosus]|uniref:Uncharacterized protein n=1 Tax=Araneus ventricosus TaxID=182803 RepID=A0A4Y2VU68_ARAVE|nr:hypothetical protein AVEN_103965-1 [Araneus ventricosus]
MEISVQFPTGVPDCVLVMGYRPSHITDRKYIPNNASGSPKEQGFRQTSTFAKTERNTKCKAAPNDWTISHSRKIRAGRAHFESGLRKGHSRPDRTYGQPDPQNRVAREHSRTCE